MWKLKVTSSTRQGKKEEEKGHLITTGTGVRFRGIIRTDEPRLILLSASFGLTECEPTVPAHPLHRTYFLDRLLEPATQRRT